MVRFSTDLPIIKLTPTWLPAWIQPFHGLQCPLCLGTIHGQPSAKHACPTVILSGENHVLKMLLVIADEGKDGHHGGSHQDTGAG